MSYKQIEEHLSFIGDLPDFMSVDLDLLDINSTDLTSTQIQDHEINRLDLVSLRIYGTVKAKFLIAWLNKWDDYINDCVPGEIKYIVPERMKTLFNQMRDSK